MSSISIAIVISFLAIVTINAAGVEQHKNGANAKQNGNGQKHSATVVHAHNSGKPTGHTSKPTGQQSKVEKPKVGLQLFAAENAVNPDDVTQYIRLAHQKAELEEELAESHAETQRRRAVAAKIRESAGHEKPEHRAEQMDRYISANRNANDAQKSEDIGKWKLDKTVEEMSHFSEPKVKEAERQEERAHRAEAIEDWMYANDDPMGVDEGEFSSNVLVHAGTSEGHQENHQQEKEEQTTSDHDQQQKEEHQNSNVHPAWDEAGESSPF